MIGCKYQIIFYIRILRELATSAFIFVIENKKIDKKTKLRRKKLLLSNEHTIILFYYHKLYNISE